MFFVFINISCAECASEQIAALIQEVLGRARRLNLLCTADLLGWLAAHVDQLLSCRVAAAFSRRKFILQTAAAQGHLQAAVLRRLHV